MPGNRHGGTIASGKKKSARAGKASHQLTRERAVSREISYLLDRLRLEIKTRGFTQARVARALGLSPSTLSAFLLGKRSGPLDRVLLICHVIGLSSAELFLRRGATAEQQLQILLQTRRYPHELLGELDEAARVSAARELQAAAEKRLRGMSASERNYLNKLVRWCRACVAADRPARRRPGGRRRRCMSAHHQEGRSCRVL